VAIRIDDTFVLVNARNVHDCEAWASNCFHNLDAEIALYIKAGSQISIYVSPGENDDAPDNAQVWGLPSIVDSYGNRYSGNSGNFFVMRIDTYY
jgi:hypothetical protein